eukprot:scaffold6323_cov121-Isochrysis_galbana.AAC.7
MGRERFAVLLHFPVECGIEAAARVDSRRRGIGERWIAIGPARAATYRRLQAATTADETCEAEPRTDTTSQITNARHRNTAVGPPCTIHNINESRIRTRCIVNNVTVLLKQGCSPCCRGNRVVFRDIFRASCNTPGVALKQPWSHMTQQHWTWKEGTLNTLTVRNVAHRALLQGRSKVVGRHSGDALELAWLAAQHDSTWLARQLYSTGVSPVSNGSVCARKPPSAGAPFPP